MNDEKLKIFLLARDKNICQMCGQEFSPNELELDHYYPKSKGGSDHWRNRQLLCGPCNRKKSDKLPFPGL